MAAVAAPGFPGWVIEHGYLRELQPWETLRDDLPSARTSPIVAPPPRNSLDPARARLERLLLDDAPPPPPRPLISTRVIDGRLPSPSKVRAAEAAVDHVPAAIRAKLSRAGANRIDSRRRRGRAPGIQSPQGGALLRNDEIRRALRGRGR